jgi:hypothetical protein
MLVPIQYKYRGFYCLREVGALLLTSFVELGFTGGLSFPRKRESRLIKNGVNPCKSVSKNRYCRVGFSPPISLMGNDVDYQENCD